MIIFYKYIVIVLDSLNLSFQSSKPIGVSNMIRLTPVGFQAKTLEFSPYQKTKGIHDK
jgi:hypothetical protein